MPLSACPILKVMSTATPRILSLDGLRGVAAVGVMLYHFSLVARPELGTPTWALLTQTPVKLLFAGTESVLIFFVLSGLVDAKHAGHLSGPLVAAQRSFTDAPHLSNRQRALVDAMGDNLFVACADLCLGGNSRKQICVLGRYALSDCQRARQVVDRKLAFSPATPAGSAAECSLGPCSGGRGAHRGARCQVATDAPAARNPARAVARQDLVQSLSDPCADHRNCNVFLRFKSLVVGWHRCDARERWRGITVSALDRNTHSQTRACLGRPHSGGNEVVAVARAQPALLLSRDRHGARYRPSTRRTRRRTLPARRLS